MQRKANASFLPSDLDRENMENIQHLPSQKENGDQNHHDGHHFAKAETPPAGFEAACGQAEDIQRGETEHDCPEDIVDVISRSSIQEAHSNTESDGCLRAGDGIDSQRSLSASSNLDDQTRG
jgi:hypothetical protein